jgi:hypothetical protein
MGLPGNLTLAVGGALVEGAVFCLVILSVRYVVRSARPKPQQPIRMTATVGRELPAPSRKEISR